MLIQTFERTQNGIDLYKLVSDKLPTTFTKEDYKRKDFYFYKKSNPEKLYTGIIDIEANTRPEDYEEVIDNSEDILTTDEMGNLLSEVF